MDAACGQQRQNRVQLLVPHERFAADNRYVQRPMTIDQIDDAVDQRLALEVADFAERQVAAQVIVAIGVAARAVQRAFTRDLDRQRRLIPGEDSTPRGQDPVHPPTIAVELWYS